MNWEGNMERKRICLGGNGPNSEIDCCQGKYCIEARKRYDIYRPEYKKWKAAHSSHQGPVPGPGL
jgi:hypothetical protein